MNIFKTLATGAQAFEIIAAVVIIIVTVVALYFLYRNVAIEIHEARKAKLALKERESRKESGEQDEIEDINIDSKELRDLGLFALINHYIQRTKEGELAALYSINLDDFAGVVEANSEKDIAKVIAEISKRLKKYGGKNAITGHLSEDTFLFYFHDTIDAESMNKIGEELLDLIKEPVKQIDSQLTASIGVVVFPYDGINAEQLYKNSEVAIYVAKKAGKDQFHMYSEDLITTEQNNIEYYKEIKKSILNDEFVLYYQTIVDIRTGKIIGLESLLRWNHPTKGILPPGKFLNVMELTGDINWFGTWGFEKNVKQYKDWVSKTRIGDLFISTNLSPKQLEAPGLAQKFYEITKKYGLSTESFCLEIIDYFNIIQSKTTMNNLAEFRKLGFRLAVDDMGPNYEIIKNMQSIYGNIFKISRENVLDIMEDNENAEYVRRAVKTAKEKSKIVIAEGVENEEMIKKMYELDIRFMQGYYFNQPKSVLEIEKMVLQPPWDLDSFQNIIK